MYLVWAKASQRIYSLSKIGGGQQGQGEVPGRAHEKAAPRKGMLTRDQQVIPMSRQIVLQSQGLAAYSASHMGSVEMKK